MASSGVNVLRYTSLLTGIFYGLYHQRSITAQSRANHLDADFKRREGLVQQAKAEWKKKTAPAAEQTTAANVITDPSNPLFDLETLLSKVADGSVQV